LQTSGAVRPRPLPPLAAVDRGLADLRTALEAILTHAPAGARMRRAADLERWLEIKTKLAWQVWNVVHAENPLAAWQHLPGPAGIEIVLRAAGARGVPAKPLSNVRAALAALEQIAREHADSRESLATMLSHAGGDAAERVDEEFREMLFRGASAVWGIQARVQVVISIMHSGRTSDRVDVVSVRGLVDLRRLRPDVPWVVNRLGTTVPKKDHGDRYAEPLARVKPGLPPLLADFCSAPQSAFRLLPVSETRGDIELLPGPVGKTGDVTVFAGEVFRNLDRYRCERQPRGEIAPVVFTPTELYVHDVFVHPGAEPLLPFRVKTYGDPRGEGLENLVERNRIPVAAQLRDAGVGPSALHLATVPRYAELIESIHKRLGWDATKARLHRLLVRYPVVPSVVLLEFDLPERPARETDPSAIEK
jgi:hypothetical protein